MTSLAPRILLPILIIVFLMPASGHVREDTAQLTLKKSASPTQTTLLYRIKPGDTLSNIVTRQYGETEYGRKEAVFARIRRLNPALKNIHRIFPGQVVLLPSADRSVLLSDSKIDVITVRTRNRDTLQKIIRRELHVSSRDLPGVLGTVKKMNPEIRNLNRITPGQRIRLPVINSQGETSAALPSAPDKESPVAPAPAPHPPADQLSAIRNVVSRLQGSVITTGNYYLPLNTGGQITVDCAIIPVVEFPDGSTVFLDYYGRMPDTLKKVIQKNWKNYHWVRIRKQDPLPLVLYGIISHNTSVGIKKNTQSVLFGDSLKISIRPEWLIAGRVPSAKGSRNWGLCTGLDQGDLLPAPVHGYLERSGFSVIEVLRDGHVAPAPVDDISPVEIPLLRSGSAKELAQSLLSALGYQPRLNAEVQIFSQTHDGFNLTVKCDLLVERDGHSVILQTKHLPVQFTDILRKKNFTYEQLPAGENKSAVIARVLTAMKIPFTTGRFPLILAPEGKKSRIAAELPATKIADGNRIIYLTHLDLDRTLYGWLNKRGGINIIRF